MTDRIHTTTRRAVLAGTAALAGAATMPALPAVAAETLSPACQVDRVGFARRLHRWAFHCPELGDRIDAMLSRVDYVLSTGEGTGELLETVELCRTRLGRDVSIDWLVAGDTYPDGRPNSMFHDEPDSGMSPDEERAALLGEFDECTVEEQAGLLEMVSAMKRHDYAAARHWIGHLNSAAGVTVAQI